MYDELVRRLREHNGWALNETLDKAADAIEAQDRHILTLQREMMAEAESHITEVKRLNKQIDVLSKMEKTTQWIPVTERLPKGEAERYLVAADLMSYGLRVSICYYAENLEEVDEYDFEGENHSGFYGIDDEYGYYEKTGVRYWMPLPEPPKEET